LSGGEAFVAQETPYTERVPAGNPGAVSGALDDSLQHSCNESAKKESLDSAYCARQAAQRPKIG
jgi:hypothetical protein